ncbi:beta-ketoacyl synthase N-terminal-like domain-containing protein [Micromonospora sp. NPDC003197]
MTQPTTIRRFIQIADRFPDNPVIVSDDSVLTYAELVAQAGGYAAVLTEAGVRTGERIGLLTDHGGRTIASILGVLAHGGVYVPLDASFPVERLRHVLDAAAVTTVLTDPEYVDLARGLCGPDRRLVVVPDQVPPAPLRARPVDLDEYAYVLCTSGSTGVPKAVAQTHRNLLHAVDNQIATLTITPADRLSLLASFSFDAAIPDLYPALLTGAAVVPIDLRRHGVPYAAAALARHGVTVYHSTPTVYRYLLDALDATCLDQVRVVLFGGEQSTYADVARGRARFAPDCVFVNGYGATEVTFATQYQLPSAESVHDHTGPLPIGTALPGYEVSLVAGTGEIAVTSHHVIPGYLNQDSDRFQVGGDGRITYRTGDLGQLRPDGDLVCLGRLDRQVKVRGFRVELTEIESGLIAQPGVVAARAIARDGQLLAYVRLRPEFETPNPAQLRDVLAQRLPDYALPRAVVVIDEFPLTVTGKIDERALPDPEMFPVAPQRSMTPTERTVHGIWCTVLGVDQVGLDDSFFDLGGHSLSLGQVQQRLTTEFGVRVPMLRLFDHSTVTTQARFLDGLTDSTQPTGEEATTGTPSGSAGPGDQAAHDTPAVGMPAAARDYTGDEIAVIGLAGRFPGAPDVSTLWWNLCAGTDSIHDYTEEELTGLGIGPGLRGDPRHVRAGGRLDGVADFDAEFFSFGAEEAARTDPQHRLFLETSWEALEDAGHDAARFDGTIGVFAATSANRYFLFHLMDNPAVVGEVDPDDWEARILPRQFTDHLPGQVAYRLGLTGPAVAVQSACSSSLVAVATAAQSLLDYQCDVALAGGVSVTSPRYRYVTGGMASADGRCRAFDEAADGSGFSSGAGVVVLRRLADALADRDRIYAILPGWAVTNDGADRAGFAVPGPAGQAAAIAGALAAADITPDEVRLVEAHGSGTPLGDAIEVAALNEAYGDAGQGDRCALGSIKTNIGHLDAGAGVAGLIKAVLAVHHGVIPPNLHFTRPHPEVDLAGGPFYVPTKVQDWPAEARRVAGVSSFGMGGTNAHVLVEQAPPVELDHATSEGWSGGYLLPVSARTPAALRAAIQRLRQHLATGAPSLPDVAYTLAVGRREFACRAVVGGTDLAEVIAALDELLATDGQLAGVSADLRDIGARWVTGGQVEWPGIDGAAPGRRLRLPTYPFQRARFWIDPPVKEQQR